jgi:glycosyltransferase involved in cell wall biosynthesis
LTNKPRISVIVPVRNNEDTIAPVLQALLNQDQENYEVIVVDGSSTDQTRDIAARYPVKILVEEGKGPNYARNLGVQNASGEIVAFIDGDCKPDKGWLKALVENFASPETGCVGGTIAVWNGESYLARYGFWAKIPVMPRFESRMTQHINRFNELPVSANMAVKKEVFAKVGLFDTVFRGGFEETDLLWRIVKAGYKIIADPKAIVYHRHRTTLKGLLKQTWAYGIGAGLYCRKHPDSPVTRKYHRYKTAFLMSIGGLVLSIALATLYSPTFYILTAFIVLAPLGWSTSHSIRVARKNREWTAIFYPIFDYIRATCFCLGQMYGEHIKFRGEKNKAN